MPILITLLVLGAAAGFLATRFMKVQPDVPPTTAIGIGGALLGWLVLRFLPAIGGWFALSVGAILCAMALLWLLPNYAGRS